MVSSAFISVFFAALFSWGLLRVLIPILYISVLDQPNTRSSHRHATPRAGGISFVLVALGASFISCLPSFYFVSPSFFISNIPSTPVKFTPDIWRTPTNLTEWAPNW